MAYSVQIVADSVNDFGCRLTTFALTYPRVILAEVGTHCILAKSSSSSRAVPVEKLLKQVEDDPYIPPRFGLRGRGMQDHGVLSPEEQAAALEDYLWGRDRAVETARRLAARHVSKQIVNRAIENYGWVSTVLTGTEWSNFFSLRAHDDADPAFQKLADMMLAAYAAGVPAHRPAGEWHLPFVTDEERQNLTEEVALKASAARCARVSYSTHLGKVDVQADVELVDEKLLPSGHMSPFDHPARSMTGADSIGRFRGWMAYRRFIPGESGEDRPLPRHRLTDSGVE